MEFCWEAVKLEQTERSENPAARRYFTASYHDGSFYLFGGNLPNKTPTNLFHIFNPEKRTFVIGSQEGEFPSPRGGHAAAVNNGKLYIFGGIREKTSLNDLYVFDIASGKWEQIKETEGEDWPSPREHCSLLTYNNELYLFGGSNGIKKYKNDFYRFNCETKKFSKIEYSTELVPEARAGHLAFIRNNEMVVFGGFCGDGGFTYLSDSLVVSLDAPDQGKKWKSIEMKGLAAATARPITYGLVGKHLYVFGGYAGDQPTSIFRHLDIEKLEWNFNEIWMAMDSNSINAISASTSTKATRPFARYGHATCALPNGDVYVFGGTGSMYLNDIIRFSPIE